MPQPQSSFSVILNLIGLDGYSVTQILCPEAEAEDFRASQLCALQQEQSKTNYFQQAS